MPGEQQDDYAAHARADVGTLQEVLQALADPVRLEMVRRLAHASDGTVRCALLYDDVSKSTASHHFKQLIAAGITERRYIDGTPHQVLRKADLDAALPGVLDSVVAALDAE